MDTDIGVVYYWYQLMSDGNDYESVNMNILFWCGIMFILLYRLITLIVVSCDVIILDALDCSVTIDADCYDPILVLLDLYIFKVVYRSFKTANETLSNNAKIRKARQEKGNEMNQTHVTEVTQDEELSQDEEKEIKVSADLTFFEVTD